LPNRTRSVRIRRLDDGRAETTDDQVPAEHTLRIYLDDTFIIALSCSDSALEALAVGHLRSADHISPDATVRVFLDPGEDTTVASVVHTAQDTHAAGSPPAPVRSTTLYADTIYENMKRLTRDSSLFHATGAAHCTGFFRGTKAHIIHDDIARHNTVDRVIGQAHLERIDLSAGMVGTTGRVSSEIAARCAAAGVTVLVSRGAPTHLAVQIARRENMTLLGFARGRRFNCYTHCHRIQSHP